MVEMIKKQKKTPTHTTITSLLKSKFYEIYGISFVFCYCATFDFHELISEVILGLELV